MEHIISVHLSLYLKAASQAANSSQQDSVEIDTIASGLQRDRTSESYRSWAFFPSSFSITCTARRDIDIRSAELFFVYPQDPKMGKPQSFPTVSAQESDQHTPNQTESVADGQNTSLDGKTSLHKQTEASVLLSNAAVAWQNDSTVNMSTSEDGVANTCPVESATGNISDQQLPSPENGHEKGMSMKHLTCYFWSENGHCKYSEADCLYSHTETGRVAGPPTQIEPGGKSGC